MQRGYYNCVLYPKQGILILLNYNCCFSALVPVTVTEAVDHPGEIIMAAAVAPVDVDVIARTRGSGHAPEKGLRSRYSINEVLITCPSPLA